MRGVVHRHNCDVLMRLMIVEPLSICARLAKMLLVAYRAPIADCRFKDCDQSAQHPLAKATTCHREVVDGYLQPSPHRVIGGDVCPRSDGVEKSWS